MKKKHIGISIPCFNEEENVVPIVEKIDEMFKLELTDYDYHIQFIDNNSTDNTRKYIRELCERYPDNIRGIFNAKNFPMTSGYYGMIKTGGDCTINIPCDFQVPLFTIPKMIKKWEKGAKAVCLVKESSKENRLMWGTRQLYYSLSNMFSESKIPRNYYGAGLYDKALMELVRKLDDPSISFTQFLVEYGYDIVWMDYPHAKRRAGKSKQSFWTLCNIAISRFVKSSTISLRFATVFGGLSCILSILIGIIYLILKLIYWDNFIAGMAPLLVGFFFISSVQLFFIGLVGEYVLKANTMLAKRPLVIERERVNFKEEDSIE